MDSNKKLTPAARRNLEQFLPDSSLAADIRAALADLDSAEGACSVFADNEERCDVILRGLGLDDTVNVTPRLATLAAMYRTQCRANVSEAARADAEIDQLKSLLADSVPCSTFNALAEEKGAEIRAAAAFYKDAKELLAAEKARADAAERMVCELREACVTARPFAFTTHVVRVIDAAIASTADIAGRWVSVEEHARLRDLFDQDGKALIRARTERDAAIARAEEAHADAMEKLDLAIAATKARDEVGIQLAAAQAEIARLAPFEGAARRAVIIGDVASLVDLVALDTVPGDALAPGNVKGGE
jgi:hypothetical protein